MAIQLLVEIIGDASKLSGALDDATAKTTGFGGSIGSTVTSMLPMAAAAAGVAVAIAGMTQAAAEDRAEQDKLVLAYQNATGSTQDYTAAIDAAIESGAAKAFSDTEIRDALTGLITATGDAAAANAALGPTLDIARAAGVSAEVAADAYSKALAGNDAALRKLFPGMEKQASAADTITEATKLSAGAADEYAKSAEGMAKIGGDAFGELGEEVGGAFLPIMDALIPALVPFIQLLGQIIKAILPPLTVAINVVVAALKIMISVLSTIVDWISKLIGWLNDAIGAIGRFLDSINPLKGISLPSLPFGLAATGGTGGAAMARSGRSGPGAGGGGVTVNVYGGDPHAIERAVARGFRGWTGISGRTAGTREF